MQWLLQGACLNMSESPKKITHATAQTKAIRRLVDLHRKQYQELYRDECAKLGLDNNPTKEQRIAKLKEQLQRLEEKNAYQTTH
jgi:hypothetical protein